MTEAWGRAPGPAEVAPYWQQMVERNRPSLARPDDPDLLFAGQAVVLPEPPPVPSQG